MQRLDGVGGCAEHREPLGDVAGLEGAAEEGFKPLAGELHL